MIAANADVKITPYLKEKSKLTEYQKRIDIIKLVKQKISDHNLVSEDHWDVNLINFNTAEWVLNKLLSKINEGVFTELFKDGRLCFY